MRQVFIGRNAETLIGTDALTAEMIGRGAGEKVGALVAPTPSVIVLTETASEFPALKAVGARTYGWNGTAYEPRSPAPPEVIDELESRE